MAKHFVHYTCYLIVFTSCVDRGHGRWKERDRESLQYDIDVFKRMAEKIEHEIEAFYEDYPDQQIKDDEIEKIYNNHLKNTLDRKTNTKNKLEDRKDPTHNVPFFPSGNITTDVGATKSKPQDIGESNSYSHVSFRNNINTLTRDSDSRNQWPKFEDILLAMGKRYDWKNDRWIKVKGKLKELRTKQLVGIERENRISFYEKHKFSYRTVKLNRKSRRNVVIAVSAVR